jgi:PAS domain S-box-containing protein
MGIVIHHAGERLAGPATEEMLTRATGRQGELVGLLVALTILATVAALAYRSIDAAADTLSWVEHTQDVLRQVEAVNAAYSRAASARRSYVVAGDTAQLGEVGDLDAHVADAIAALRHSLSDNPGQLRRLDLLEHLLAQRIAALDSSVEHRRTAGSGVETADGLALAAHIRAVREEMVNEESTLLARRDAQTRRDVATTKLTEVLGTLASFVILLIAFRRLRQEVGRRQRSEQALRVSESFLDSLIENLPDMLFVKDAGELRFERINRAGEALLGLTREDLLHKNDFDFFPKDQAEAFQARDRETLAGRVVIDVAEEPIETKEGTRWLHTKKVPILDEQGTPMFLLGISEDVTARREAAVALATARDSAEAANQELEAFSYSVAHDLRAPLRAIDGFSQALEEDCAHELGADGKDYLKRVRAAVGQMAQLIDGLLSLSRLTRGEIARDKVDLTAIAQGCAARLREATPTRPVELMVAEGLVADGDARLLTAALDNLLGNAWKFTGKTDSARIQVGKRVEGGQPVFFVQDNGAGFEQAYADKLFGAFQRLHTATEFEGSGIGLATVQRIVRRHGGRVWAEGEVGRGATFYFTLQAGGAREEANGRQDDPARRGQPE